MKVLVLNSGSSSIKYQLFRSEDWTAIASGMVARIGETEGEMRLEWLDADGVMQRDQNDLAVPSHQEGIDFIVETLQSHGVLGDVSELSAIGHRVVHGGPHFKHPVIVDADVLAELHEVIPLAPLHNPGHLAGIEVARKHFPSVPSVVVFDTAFHQTMPPTAYRYAIPEYLYTEHRIRRYGFHGTSHHYVAKRAAELLGKPLEQCNLITMHLGNGASASAIRNGRCVDTSMGLTPLEGLVMGTRCGDMDPAVPIYLSKHLGLNAEAIDHMLNRQSGLLGICGVNDMREVVRLAERGNERAELALGMMTHRLKKYIGAYYAELGAVDAIVFTGGIGENSAEVRAGACAGLEALGIELDATANAGRADEAGLRISTAESRVQLWVIPTNEELEIAQQTLATVERKRR
ncbi:MULTISPECIES: acetate/propionate family kinase [Marichromatium]|uniref:Acetate kinase n=1 Tax=Marichromatium gracile TaxID=1048 RepID=A0A4R4ADW2_MARGR|nr:MULTISPECIES: acetate kinase [Marichromatium]MBK1709954.1 acetate kinase [Marichromatium gracile]RNE91615.1 acetate kinase [Marichromatium sp. AB31]RNE93439.1 acetate kinase [Marichromatium sp. AB32]TCW36909.1 acetate kinase [Marichromatium gracile]